MMNDVDRSHGHVSIEELERLLHEDGILPEGMNLQEHTQLLRERGEEMAMVARERRRKWEEENPEEAAVFYLS